MPLLIQASVLKKKHRRRVALGLGTREEEEHRGDRAEYLMGLLGGG
jgi:hypothetical protein